MMVQKSVDLGKVLTALVLHNFHSKGILAHEIGAKEWLDFPAADDESSNVRKMEFHMIVTNQSSFECLEKVDKNYAIELSKDATCYLIVY